jgi:methionyl-tRNA formyltransferase
LPNDAAQMTYFTFPTRADVLAFQAAGKRFF